MNLQETSRDLENILRAFIGYRPPPKEASSLERANHLLENAHELIHKYQDATLTKILMEFEAALIEGDPRILPTYMKAIGTLFPEEYSTGPITHIGSADVSKWRGGCSEAAKVRALQCYETQGETLDLTLLKLDKIPIELLKTLPFVKKLIIGHSEADILTIPKEMVSLEKLCVYENHKMTTLTVAGSLPNLQEVEICENRRLNSVQFFGEVPSLENVYIYNNKNLETLSVPKEVQEFKKTDLSGNNLHD